MDKREIYWYAIVLIFALLTYYFQYGQYNDYGRLLLNQGMIITKISLLFSFIWVIGESVIRINIYFTNKKMEKEEG